MNDVTISPQVNPSTRTVTLGLAATNLLDRLLLFAVHLRTLFFGSKKLLPDSKNLDKDAIKIRRDASVSFSEH